MLFKKKPPTPTLAIASDLERAKRAAAILQTWEEAEAALTAFKTSRDNSDRELAAAKLLAVMQQEVRHVIRSRVKVDQKLPAAYRRDFDEMGEDAVLSVLSSKRAQMSVLAENHDPNRATLRTHISRWLYNKIIDYTRKESVPGLLNGAIDLPATNSTGTAASELRRFSQSLLPHNVTPSDSASVLVPHEAAPQDHQAPKAAHSQVADQAPSYQDDHSTQQLIHQFKAVLPADEFDIFCYEFEGASDVDGHADLCLKRGDKTDAKGDLKPYMSIATYRRKREQMQAILQQHFPEVRW